MRLAAQPRTPSAVEATAGVTSAPALGGARIADRLLDPFSDEVLPAVPSAIDGANVTLSFPSSVGGDDMELG